MSTFDQECVVEQAPLLGSETQLEDLELLRGRALTVGVPWTAPVDLRRLVFAAGQTYVLGNDSVDRMIEEYGDAWGFESQVNPERMAIFEATAAALHFARSELGSAFDIPNKPDVPSLVVAGAALYRLLNTFRAASFAIRELLHFEASQLQKLILEQLAWVVAIKGTEEDAFFGIMPSSSVGKLKELYPKAGRLYGRLNEAGHLQPEQVRRYLVPTEGGLGIKLGSFDESRQDAWVQLILADCYSAVIAHTFGAFLESERVLEQGSEGDVRLRQDRPGVELLSRFRERLLRHKN